MLSFFAGKWKTGAAVFLLLSLLSIACGQRGPISTYSPDRNIQVTVTETGGINGDSLMYHVWFHGRSIVENSPLGLLLKSGASFSRDLKITHVTTNSMDETYHMPHGKAAKIRNHYNETTIGLRNNIGTKLEVIFRVFDDGVAFRYYFPDRVAAGTLEITRELSAFNFTGNHRYWGLHLDSYTTSYEKEYTIASLATIGADAIIGLPMLIQVGTDAWVGLTEANLTDYAGMYVRIDPGNKTCLQVSLAPLPDSSGVCVRTESPRPTPWRVLMSGDDPGRLVESNIVLNLNEPCAIDTSWIKPGVAINDWTSDHTVEGAGFTGAMDNRTMKHYIDFCGDYGLEYMSIDAGWYEKNYWEGKGDLTKPIPEINIPELVEYAAARGVEVFLWTFGPVVRRQMEEAFAQFERWGVKGLNIDFNNRDDQEMVNFVNHAIKKAADHKLHIEFHGIYKPTGLSRTWPNLLSHEGVLGLEYAKWDRKPTPEHNCILPFTRMLAGPMDYIPVGFTNATRENYKIVSDKFMTLGTRCQQLAHLVIFESGFQVLADYPANYRNQPGHDFLRRVPAAWDETRVLHASVGDYVTIARRHGNNWFMGSITDWNARQLEVPLRFLGPGTHVAEIYADGPNADRDATSTSITRTVVTQNDVISVKMAPGGGHAVWLYPAPGDM